MQNRKIFKDSIKNAQNIVITTHLHPDADGIGAQIALALALTQLKKNVICVNQEALDCRYKYLDPNKVVISYNQYKVSPLKSIDLLIIVDTNSLSRIGTNLEGLVLCTKNILFIDHHPCPRQMQAIHCIDTEKAATGELIAELIFDMKVEMSKVMALALYTAIIIDTSSFRYPTVSSNTHAIVSKLLKSGIRPPEAFNLINGTKKIGHMQLLGEVLSSAKNSKDESIAWITLSEKIIKKFDGDAEDTHGFINHLLILDNIKVACMFRQIGKQVKVSLRTTRQGLDVGIMAQALGGGGHNHSAATVIEGELQEVTNKTISKIKMMLTS